MSVMNRIRATSPGKPALAAAVVAAIALASWGAATSASGQADTAGQPPPEWAENLGAWPAHNYDLSNTRATAQTPINSQTVSNLKVKWRFRFRGCERLRILRLDSDRAQRHRLPAGPQLERVRARPREWQAQMAARVQQAERRSERGRLRRGRIYGATDRNAFALDATSGRLLWSRKLTRSRNEGIDTAPQLYDNTVLLSTVPGNSRSFYAGGARGVVYALDATSGKIKWRFETVKGGKKLWGNPRVNSGGGFWYPPAVDDQGRVFIPVANPAPYPGTPKFPNGSSRPGPNLYTNSLVVLDGQTGRLLWYRQPLPHDIRDYDLESSPILATVDGVETVMVSGKVGKVYAYRSDNGRHLWTRSVGRHQNDAGPLPRKPVQVYPGELGGVETPMAFAENRLFVPWLDFPSRSSATRTSYGSFAKGRGGLTALAAVSGRVLWERKLPQMNFGAATVANDVVFTTTFDGTIYGLDAQSGRTLWRAKARAGVNSFPAIDGDTLLVGAAAPGFFKKPVFELIAYRLS